MNIPELVNTLKRCKDSDHQHVLIEQLETALTQDKARLAPPQPGDDRVTLADRILPGLDHPF